MDRHGRKVLTLATLFTVATGIIHVSNRFIDAASQLKEMLDVSRRNFYDWRFGQIYYTKKGSGNPVLLIHDMLPGASGYEWSRIEDQLATQYTVYTIDLLGSGRSEKPGITYTNFVYVQMLCDFVKNIIGQKTDVIASGFSSSFAVMACNYDNECFNKLMLVNPPSLSSLEQMPSDKDKFFKYVLEIPVFGTLIYHMMTARETLENYFTENVYHNPFHVDETLIDTYYEAAHKGGYYAKYQHACFLSKYMNISIKKALANIDNSIYIIGGEFEANSNAIVEKYIAVNPAIEFSVIPATKHMPHMEDPEKFLEQVGDFF